MSTKDTVAQNVFTHMALYRLSPLLDQMASGLKKSGVLRMVQAFPDLYAQLFLYCGRLSAEDVLQAVCVDEEQSLKGIQLLWLSSNATLKNVMKLVSHNHDIAHTKVCYIRCMG